MPAPEKDAAEAAAEVFVAVAYGYRGADAGAYEREIDGRVVGNCFWGSQAGEELGAVEEMVRRGGEAEAPDGWGFAEPEGFVGYYVNGEEKPDKGTAREHLLVYGHAVWVSRTAGSSEGEGLVGRQQGLTLLKGPSTDGEWKVASGEGVADYVSSEYEPAVDEKIAELGGGEATD